METRKVQLTGGSTYTVSLPKEWATANDVEAGSEIQFHPEDERLVLSPQRDHAQSTGTFDVGSRDGETDLTRVVITMYVSGFDEIRLTGDRLSADQRQVIRQATQGLVGLEIIEETQRRVVLQDLLDASELDIENSLERMRLVALTMVGDAVRALIDNDDGLARDVIDRDDDVDRLWFMVSRIFRTVLRNPAASTAVDLDRETVFDYQSGARQLERVADHATKIAGVATTSGRSPIRSPTISRRSKRSRPISARPRSMHSSIPNRRRPSGRLNPSSNASPRSTSAPGR